MVSRDAEIKNEIKRFILVLRHKYSISYDDIIRLTKELGKA